ncbi:MAG: hypothetical protein NTW79_04215 [Candidatus Berkelbacteria bacterium]|nr:hypothetical protein [Candidatus Berkelbacteria bacterium]
MESENSELKKLVLGLKRATERSNSLGWSFLRGLFTAAGGTIGLAILITVAIFVLTKVPDTNAVGKFFHALANIINRNQH